MIRHSFRKFDTDLGEHVIGESCLGRVPLKRERTCDLGKDNVSMRSLPDRSCVVFYPLSLES